MNYTNIPEIDKILEEVENILTESIGRYEAQRFIALFSDLNGRNIWEEIFEKGKKEAKP